MRVLVIVSVLLLSGAILDAQKSAPPPRPAETTPPAAPAAPAPRPAAQGARSQMSILVTDPQGVAIASASVEASGPTPRTAPVGADGRLSLTGLLPGTYRLRFSGDGRVDFEREVTLRGGQTTVVDVVLNPAPPPPEPAAPPPPVVIREPAVAGPAGRPQTLGIVDLLDKEFIGRQPQRETLLSCSGNERATMVQLNDPLPARLYENADLVYYVLGGSGAITIDGRETRIETNGFISVPRGTRHGFTRRGGRPLVLLAVLSGDPCETAK